MVNHKVKDEWTVGTDWYTGNASMPLTKVMYANWATNLWPFNGYGNATVSSLAHNNYSQWIYSLTVSNIVTFTEWKESNLSVRVVESAEDIVARKVREADRQAAKNRAEELLLACLTPEQAEAYRKHGHFETIVDDRIYRIRTGRSGNVELIENGKPIHRYCAHPDVWTPDQDVMLSQLLMLKTNEKLFLNTANRTILAA